jgi:hypothetical protein
MLSEFFDTAECGPGLGDSDARSRTRILDRPRRTRSFRAGYSQPERLGHEGGVPPLLRVRRRSALSGRRRERRRPGAKGAGSRLAAIKMMFPRAAFKASSRTRMSSLRQAAGRCAAGRPASSPKWRRTARPRWPRGPTPAGRGAGPGAPFAPGPGAGMMNSISPALTSLGSQGLDDISR